MDKYKFQLNDAIDEFNLNSEARKELFYKIRELNKQMAEYDEKSNRLKKFIQDLKDMIACGDMSLTPGFNKLTEEEQKIIVKGMDKTDYTKYSPEVARFYDLERLIQNVLDFKVKYPGWVLKSVIKSGQHDTMPPENYYKFSYMSPHGHYFTFGGIEIIS
jgi:hypothetical protein